MLRKSGRPRLTGKKTLTLKQNGEESCTTVRIINLRLILKTFQNVDVPEQIEIKPSNGHFDIFSFDDVCIYNSDYMATRTKMAASVDAHKTEDSVRDVKNLLKNLKTYKPLHYSLIYSLNKARDFTGFNF